MKFAKIVVTVLMLCTMPFSAGAFSTESVREALETMKFELQEKGMLSDQVSATSYYDEGNDGSSETTAYIIDSISDLQLLVLRTGYGTEPSGKYYRLDTDLDISGISSWVPIGVDMDNPFTGHFDGNSKTINIKSTTGAPIFGAIKTSGVALKNLNVTGSVSGEIGSGIVLWLEAGIVQDCVFKGTIKVSDSSASHLGAGGIVEVQEGGTVKNCSVLSGSSISVSSGSISYVGGIVGGMTGGNVTNCTANATLSGTYKGGIVGAATQSVVSNISGNSYTGANKEIGYTQSSSSNSSGGSSSGGGGCNAGFSILGLLISTAALKLKK